MVPPCSLQVLVPLPQIPQCRALYDFQLDDENEKDCLTFKKVCFFLVSENQFSIHWDQYKICARHNVFRIFSHPLKN